MLSKLLNRLDQAERRLRYSFGKDITDPAQRRWSHLHVNLFDHAFLRGFWTNFYEIAPGVYRSNQPTHRRFKKYADMGIKTVINLRGEDKRAHYLFEEESCDALGLTLVNAKLHARQLYGAKRFLAVIDAIRAAEKPVLIHCKSGADRTGIIAAIYLMIFENVPVEEAKKQLSLKYIHLKCTKTGVQDYMLDVYAVRNAADPIDFETWLRTEYNAKRLQSAFDDRVAPEDMAFPA